MTAPLWQRALEARRLEQEEKLRQAAREKGRKGGLVGRRRYPEIRIGQRFGPWTVVALLGRGFRGRSDMRVELVCLCGRRAETFEFQARKRAENGPKCNHPHPGRP